jgi:hypothetical protein
MIKLLLSSCLLLFVVACDFDEIDISLTPHDTTPIFEFKYVRKPENTIHATGVRIEEFRTGRVVWDIHTFDPSILYEKKGDKVMPRISRDLELLKSAPLVQLRFGEVPKGFDQYYPPNNKPPTLERDINYVIHIAGGAGSGRMEFTMDRECRQISLTSYSRNRPGFSDASHC